MNPFEKFTPKDVEQKNIAQPEPAINVEKTTKKMKVESISIRNFKGLQRESISIKGNNVYVLGRNGMGKTSFLDAIFKILSGKDLPAQPTHKGESSGSIELDLGKIIVKAKFNAKNEKVSVSVENKEGAEYKSPRAMLDELVGVIDFDVTQFLSLSPKKQVDFIKSIVGIDFTDLDDEYKAYYEQRTFINKRVKELDVLQQPFNKDNIELVDLSYETKELNNKRAFNATLDKQFNDIENLKKSKEDIFSEIKSLESKIESLKNDVESIEVKLTLADLFINDIENKPFDLEKEEKDYLQKIEDNKIIEENIRNKKLYDELSEMMKKQEEINQKLNNIAKAKVDAIASCELPVPGLGFTDDYLTLNGLPFESSQINKAQQIIAGLQINLALLGDVKIARFEGSLIDDENLEYIEDWAAKNDLQLFVEFVDRSAECLKIEVKEIN